MIEAAVKRRQPIPEVIAQAPSLLEGLELYYEAFSELSTCRGTPDFNGNVGPIPWTALDAYGLRHGFEGEAFDYLCRMVRALDDCFIAYMAERRDKGRGKPQ